MITPYLLTKAVVPAMRARGSGWIVNITSAIVDPGPGAQQARSSTYAPSKAALDRMTKSFATELDGTGIAVNAVAPRAAVQTEGAAAMMDLPDDFLEPMDTMVDAVLALATCDPSEENGLVVRSVPYLASRKPMSLEGQRRPGDRRGQRHRPRDRAVVRRNRARASSSPTSTKPSAIGTTRAIDGNAVAVRADVVDEDAVARDGADRGRPVRRPRLRGQQRRHRAGRQAVHRSHARRVAAHDRHRPHRRVPVHAARAPPVLAQGRGGAIVNISSAAGTVPAPGPAAVHRGEARRARAHQAGRAGVRGPGHARERGHARADRDRADARVPRRAPRPGRAHVAPVADGPHGARPRRSRRRSCGCAPTTRPT